MPSEKSQELISAKATEENFAADTVSTAFLPRAPPTIHHGSLDVSASFSCRWELVRRPPHLLREKDKIALAVRRYLASNQKSYSTLASSSLCFSCTLMSLALVLIVQIFQMSPAGRRDEGNSQKVLGWRLFKSLINHSWKFIPNSEHSEPADAGVYVLSQTQ